MNRIKKKTRAICIDSFSGGLNGRYEFCDDDCIRNFLEEHNINSLIYSHADKNK